MKRIKTNSRKYVKYFRKLNTTNTKKLFYLIFKQRFKERNIYILRLIQTEWTSKIITYVLVFLYKTYCTK